VLVERGFHLRDILAQPIRFTERLLVIVGDGGEERRDLDFVEAAERGPESLLSEVEGTDVHTGSLSQRGGSRAGDAAKAFPLIGLRVVGRQRRVKHGCAFQKWRFRYG
jgi:hypothetical protein